MKVRNLEKGIAASWLAIIFIVIGLAVGIGIGYSIAPAPTPEVGAREIGVVHWWHADEGIWEPSHAEAVKALKGKYNLDITPIEETGIGDVEAILRIAAGRYDIIYSTTDEFAEPLKVVASEYPDLPFISEWEATKLTSDDFPPNVVAINAYDAHKINFLLGAAAAKITQTDKLGIILAIAGPRSYRIVSNAFREGARHVNPDIEVTQVVMDAYTDPIRSRDTAASFAEAGIDVIFVNQDDFAATLEATVQGIYTIQQYRDVTPFYPDTIIGCGIWDWEVELDKVLNAIAEDRFEEFRAENYQLFLSLEDRSLDVPIWGNMVPESVKEYIAELREDIIAGTVVVPEITTWTP